MNKVTLKKKEHFYLDNKLYIVKQGSVCVRTILENGTIIPKEGCYRKGEILINFFSFNNFDEINLPELDLEIMALEDNTILEEFHASLTSISKIPSFDKIFKQLLKENIFNFFYHLYDKKGYLLSILKIYSDSKGNLEKDKISYEHFNMSKSQFYSTLSLLKQENFLYEKNKKIILNNEKIQMYFFNYC